MFNIYLLTKKIDKKEKSHSIYKINIIIFIVIAATSGTIATRV